MAYQWLSTVPSGLAHTHSADAGTTGWRLHAIEGNPIENTSFPVRHSRALCGLRPLHGWCLDLFIEDRCKRCQRVIKANELISQIILDKSSKLTQLGDFE